MTSRADGYEQLQVPDMDRRLAGAIRLGTISALDTAKARVRVKSGDIETGWLPWTGTRSGHDSEWSAPEVGEQVVLAAPSGDLSQAVVIGTIPQDAHPPVGNSADVTARQYKDGAREEYNRATHTKTITIPAGGRVNFAVGGSSLSLTSESMTVTIGGVTMTLSSAGLQVLGGDIETDKDVLAETVSLKHHVNTGVTAGPSNTGEPLK